MIYAYKTYMTHSTKFENVRQGDKNLDSFALIRARYINKFLKKI